MIKKNAFLLFYSGISYRWILNNFKELSFTNSFTYATIMTGNSALIPFLKTVSERAIFMDEFNFIFLALGLLMTLWSWMAVKKKALECTYPFWYKGLQFLCMAVILVPCILVTVSDSLDQVLSFSLYAQAAAFAILLFLDSAKSRFGKKVQGLGRSGNGRAMIVFSGAAATILMWAAVIYMLR